MAVKARCRKILAAAAVVPGVSAEPLAMNVALQELVTTVAMAVISAPGLTMAYTPPRTLRQQWPEVSSSLHAGALVDERPVQLAEILEELQ
jgi:hypothetical protein